MSMAQLKEELSILHTANTIKLGVYYLLKCVESSTNDYILSCNNVQLFEIAEENKENNILSCLQIGGSQLKNIKSDNENIVQFKKENEIEILKAMKTFYLNEQYCTKWNNMIGDFYGANFYAFDKINYLMPTKLKLQKLVEKRSLLIKYINDAQIANNISKLAKYIKNIKGCTQKWYIQLYNIPFFTPENKKKQVVENLIIEAKYNTALNILQNNNNNINDINDRYYPYYKDIYSIICYQYLYKQENNIENKKKYFLKMIKLLALLTQFMASSDSIICSLFADTLLNYNPNELTASDWIFICDMVISGCCFMFNNDSIYHICGSIDSYLFLLYLIQKNKLIANDEIKRIIVYNMDELFAVFDNNLHQVNAMSVLYNVKIGEKKVLWSIKKKKILKCINVENNNTNNDNIDMEIQKLICDICKKGPFKDYKALGGHKAHHTRRKTSTNTSYNIGKPLSFIKNKKHKIKTKKKINKGEYYKCRYCDHGTDHKGNVKRHTLVQHKDLKLNLNSKLAEPIICSAPKKVKIIKKNENKNNKTNYDGHGMVTRARKRKQQQMINQEKCDDESIIILDSNEEVNEPAKKKQKQEKTINDNNINFKCDMCCQECKTPQGLGSHKRRRHGISGSSRSTGYRKWRNKSDKKNKNIINIINIDDDTDSDIIILK